MKDKTQKKIVDTVYSLNQPSTTQEIADILNLSRAVTSNYLNRLYEKNFVVKEGIKPVYWCSTSNLCDNEINKDDRNIENVSNERDVFSTFIGASGSQKNVIKQCKAAITYPPNGLTILINGESGVGKSYLAKLIYQYAVQKKAINIDAPFKVLNCADYANNPELLSATLFGYKKGSFTGADSDRLGLLDYADGGYLFLDEIHRLSYENQEKLFVFMDGGKYLRLGESENWKSSSVRLIFATTENVKDVLLETFRRRISVKVSISNINERFYYEKINLIELFYKQEAERLQRNINVEENVVNILCSGSIEGNIGGIRNIIKLSCANAFVANNSSSLKITVNQIPEEYLKNILHLSLNSSSLTIDYKKEINSNGNYYDKKILVEHLIDFKEKLQKIKEDDNNIDLLISFKKLVKNIQEEKNKSWIVPIYWSTYLLNTTKIEIDTFLEKYGIIKNDLLIQELIDFLIFFHSSEFNEFNCLNSKEILDVLKKIYPKCSYITNMWEKTNMLFREINYDLISILYIFSLQNYIDEKIKFSGLLIAHGNSTAKSIQEVVNNMYNNFIFEAFDMPITSSVTEVIIKVKEYLQYFDISNGLILIVDMGSLGQLYSSIKDNIKGDLLIINNLTTSVALDVGIKIINNVPFKIIAAEIDGKYKIESQYFEAIGKNIIISCMSGIGISEKIKEILLEYIKAEDLKIITLEYQKVQELFSTKQKTSFSNTCLLITTNDIDDDIGVTCLNIYDALRASGERILWKALNQLITQTDFQRMMKELVKFFSLEGVATRLKILNPNVVISESELIIASYEGYYNIKLKGYEELNILMHLSMMTERLISNNNDYEEVNMSNMDDKEKEFFKISEDILKKAEKKFNIKIHLYEIKLLYEILKRIIFEK